MIVINSLTKKIKDNLKLFHSVGVFLCIHANADRKKVL